MAIGELNVAGVVVAVCGDADSVVCRWVLCADVTFYDYDGTIVASYTAADFANLSAMPANPTYFI